MHMADALLSPEVGGAAWVAAGSTIAYSARKIKSDFEDRKIPLMGVLGAFIFAAQMINFTIPGTGSSGHIGGGMILAILLGPYAAFLVMASILTVQALFFADGGLLALGCNIINLGAFPSFLAYPLVYRPFAGGGIEKGRITAASILSVVFALQLGSLSVVVETVLSGLADLPFWTFLMVMQPVHLGIGLIEGVVTALVVNFIVKAEPEILSVNKNNLEKNTGSMRKAISAILLAGLITGGIFSWFASENPDGLEWSILKVTGKEELKAPDKGIYLYLNKLQKSLSVLPDYGYRDEAGENGDDNKKTTIADEGKTVSGIAGGIITLIIVAATGWILRRRSGKVKIKNV